MILLYEPRWIRQVRNFGDTINPFLVSQLTGKIARYSKDSSRTRYMVSGSVIHHADIRCIVWGSGMIAEGHFPKRFPHRFRAVRGPLTREMLVNKNQEVPDVYGDPVLLFPRIFNPEVEKKYKYGIIPHYADKKNPWVHEMCKSDEIKFIDIQHQNFQYMVQEVLSCDYILSSSLHGVIIGDAYSIPSYWIKLSENVKGKGFKFLDYFASVQRTDKFIPIQKETTMRDIQSNLKEYEIKIDLDRLISECPFGDIKN